jgi:hypothetical protein
MSDSGSCLPRAAVVDEAADDRTPDAAHAAAAHVRALLAATPV